MIQIVIKDGIVQNVYSTDPEEYVEVIDLDEDPEYQYDLFDNMYEVY